MANVIGIIPFQLIPLKSLLMETQQEPDLNTKQ